MNDQTNETVLETEADETTSPVVTEGTSSSDVADDAPETAEDAVRREFMEKYGDTEPEEPGEDEAVEATVETEDPDEAETAQKPETEDEPTAEADDADDDRFRIPDEEFKALPDGVKKRLGHLNTRAKKAEREISDMSAKMEPLKDAHERFTQLQAFVSNNEIAPEAVTVGFDAMAKFAQGDMQGYLDIIGPSYEIALQATGGQIASDLQQRVDDGYLTEEDAKELTKARATGQQRDAQLTKMRQQSEAEKQAESQREGNQRVVQAINAREAHYKSSDPDYALKAKAIASMIGLAMENGAVITSPEDAVRLVDSAHQRVTENFKTPKPVAPTPPRPSAPSPSRGMPKPANAQEAITQALRAFPSS